MPEAKKNTYQKEEIKRKFNLEDRIFQLKIWHIVTVLLTILCAFGVLAWLCRKPRRKIKVHSEILTTDTSLKKSSTAIFTDDTELDDASQVLSDNQKKSKTNEP